MRAFVASLSRDPDPSRRSYFLTLTVEVDGTREELDLLDKQLRRSVACELEPLKVRDAGPAPRAHIGDRIVYDEHFAEIIADCTTQEAAEAALRLLK